ncbi:uncharacterized protein LOC141673369 [Apium graveolens]|uniref:uncharacterized protein LOC141673369 n=1 Tax=Apium graveolens TaxID=4045 RepID=UPI003D7A277C
MACISVNGINESTREQQRGSLDISCHRWRRCKACVREISPSSVDAVDKKSNELADSIKSLSLDSANSDVNCQRFSMRHFPMIFVTSGYVAEKANMNPKACIPFDGITENRWEQLRGSLDVPQYRWWRCRSCIRELVTSSTTAQDFSIKLRVDGGSQKKNNIKPAAKDVNKVDSIGESETEIPYNVSLELLASVAVEMTSDQPQLLRTSETSGMGTDAVVKEGAKALNVFTDVIDSDDEREYKKTRPLKELLWVENKAPAETGERPSSSNGSQKKNNTKPPAKDINKVDSIGESETEIPYNVSLELLASVAVEIMTSDQPQLMETSQASQRKDTSFERETSGFETDVVVEEGDKALNVFTDVIDSDDERENKKTRLMKELIWVENKVSAGKGIATQTLQQTGERPSSSNGNNTHSEVQVNDHILILFPHYTLLT